MRPLEAEQAKHYLSECSSVSQKVAALSGLWGVYIAVLSLTHNRLLGSTAVRTRVTKPCSVGRIIWNPPQIS